jgi:hypothetical protein
MSLLRRIEKSLDQRLRGIFGGARDEAGAREAIELYRDALDQIAGRASAGKRGSRIFPFDLISVELRSESAERKAVLEALFEAGQLVDDIRATLAEERVEVPANLTVAVRYPPDATVEMRILCEKNQQSAAAGSPTARRAATPFAPARLSTITGVSNLPDFTVERTHANIGRESEVVDAQGRTIRRNDLFFNERAHEANASVSRSHAHIRFDAATGEWRIYDDGSSLGTSVFHQGRRIEVPPHSTRGVLLRAGDEIYLGQVRLRFEV